MGTGSSLWTKMKIGFELVEGKCGPEFNEEGGLGYGPASVSFEDGQVSLERPAEFGLKSEAHLSIKVCTRF